jgi:hypothetical protein
MLEADGKVVSTQDAEPPPPSAKKKRLFATAFTTPTTVGEHQVRCVLDPANKLKSPDFSHTMWWGFSVDVVPVIDVGKANSGPVAANPSGPNVPVPSKAPGFAGGTPSAQGSQPKMPDPELSLTLGAQVLPNCGPGQEVLRVSGTIKNVGSGFAVIPPGKPIVKIESQIGVYGANITIGNLAPGQAQPVSVLLKAKGLPASLAGATLKLYASIIQGVIKQASYVGSSQGLTVVFPANYCKQSSTSPTTPQPMNPATTRQAPPTPQRPAPTRQ